MSVFVGAPVWVVGYPLLYAEAELNAFVTGGIVSKVLRSEDGRPALCVVSAK